MEWASNTFQILRKRKAEVLADYEENVRRHVTGNEEINELCLEWFKDAVNRCINVAEPLLKEKALVYANVLGNTNFKVMIQITMY